MITNPKNLKMLVQNPIGWLREYLMDSTRGLEKFCGRYYGIYPGKVIDNADPENRGRIRALCPAINLAKEEDVSDSYWMLPCMNGLGVDPETGQMTGFFHPPDVGTNVWVQFEFGDSRHPVYMGGWVTNKKASDTFDAEDALKKGIRTKTGHFIRMNDDAADLHLMISKGDGEGGPSPSFLTMTKEGHTMLTNDLGSTLYMNGEKPEVSLMAANEDGEVTALLSLGDDKITLATKSGGAIGISGKNVTATGDNVVLDANKQVALNGGTVMLGKGAKEPAVRGMKFMQWALIHQHTTTAPGAPTGPGATPPPMMYKELSEKVFIA